MEGASEGSYFRLGIQGKCLWILKVRFKQGPKEVTCER